MENRDIVFGAMPGNGNEKITWGEYMARVTDGLHGGGLQDNNGATNTTHFQASGADGTITLPTRDFIADADIARDGQDLVLTAPNGDTVIIDGYFSADPAPVLTAPDGSALTPALVQSFAHGAGPLQYAAASGANDASPVGAVHEIHGKATVTHPDGSSETIALGTAIYQGDVIETEGDGAVDIGFVDESSVAVSSNARLAIDEFVFDPASQGGESNFSMLRGMFVYTSGLIGREDPDDVKIGTPVGSIGIRGTTIAGNVDTGEITVVEGAIVLRAIGGGEVTLASQFGTAQFLPNGNVVQLPNTNAADIGEKFASMNNVAPAFFSTINDSAAQQESGEDGPAEGGASQQQQQDSGNTNDAPVNAPSGDSGETQDPASDPASQTMLMDSGADTSFDGGADDFSGASDSFSGEASAATESLAPSPSTGETISYAPPPSGTTQATSSGTTTTSTANETTAPPPAPPAAPTGPVVNAAALAVNENSTAATAVGAVTASNMTSPVFTETGNGTGAGLFSIDSAGNITVQSGGTLDFETQSSYTYEVLATDTNGLTATRMLTISLGNLDDENPVLNINNARTLNEGSSTILTASFLDASDIDTADANLAFTVTTGPANGQLELTTAPGTAITSFTQADIIAGRVKYVHDGGETTSDSFDFDIDDGAGHIISGNTFNLTVVAANDAPTLGTDTFSIDENSIGGAAVGTISTGADADLPGDTLSYTETGAGTGAGLFDIDSSGNITVTAGAYLDYENVSSYTYQVRISDGNGGTTTAMMTIGIGDIADETITGNTANNTLTGGAGDDVFIVNNADGSDSIIGGGETTLDIYDATAATGNMTVTLGAPGAGTAVNGANTDTFTGIEQILTGGGNDTFIINNATWAFEINAGGGTNLVDFSALTAGSYLVSADLSSGTFSINGASGGTFTSFQNIKGTQGGDTITGASSNNTIWGMAGDDTIEGGVGDDIMNGGTGNDTFIVGGGDGNDTIDGGTGSADTLLLTGGTISATLFSSVTNIEIFDALTGSNTMNIDLYASLFATDTGDVTINLDGDDTLDIDFSTFDGGGTFQLVSGNLTTSGIAQFLNSTTGNHLYLTYAPGSTAITQTGAGGAGVLYLNTLGGPDGFTISDDISEGFGYSLSFLGDIDGDGFDDIGATKSTNAPDDGRVFLLHGAAGGYGDIFLGSYPDTIHSGLFSGVGSIADDIIIARIGDFNGDGIADYIAGAPQADTLSGPVSGNAQIVDGATGSLIAELDGLSAMDMAGISIAGTGDLNRDGYADIIIGAPGSDINGVDSGSTFILFGGAYASAALIDVAMLDQPQYAGDLGAGVFGADPLDVEIFADGPGGTVAFVLKSNGQIDVINTQDPSTPFVESVSPLSNAYISGLSGYAGVADPLSGLIDIKVAGNFLYILSGNVNSATQGQITVLDISDPAAPAFIDSYTNAALLNATAIDVDLVSGHLAVTAGGGGNNSFYLLAAQADGIISGPAVGDGGVIGSLGAMTPLAGSNEIILNGNFAYIVTANDPDGAGAALPGTLQVINIATPSTPTTGAQINIENIKNIYLDKADNKLYVISSTGGTGQVWVYDTSTPGSPSLLGSSTNNAFLAGATDIIVNHGVAYVTTPGGVEAVDVTNPAAISMIGTLPDPNSTLGDSFSLALDEDGFLHVISGGTNDTLSVLSLLPQGMSLNGAGAGSLFGNSVSGINDFNGDGLHDLMIGYKNGGSGEVAILYGSPGIASDINIANAVKFTGIVTDASNEVPVMNMGDLNGDGLSDIGIMALGANSGDGNLYIMFGGGYAAGSSQTAATSADLTIWNTGVSIEAANGIGDFNGDGYDDLAVVMRSGSSADIYVVYGSDTLGGTYNLAMLDNAANAFHMNYTIPIGADPGNFDFTISSAGDLDGDGFSDLVIGLSDVDNDILFDSDGVGGTDDDSDGSALVVYGRDTGVSSATGSILSGGSGAAGANGDVLIGSDGNDILQDGGFTDVSFRGGAGDDAINLLNGNFNDIDGGGGTDIMAIFSGSGLNLSSFSAEEISRIEGIDLAGTGQLLQLTLRNIFELMEGSDTGVLSITSSGGTGNTLQIDNMAPGAQAGADENNVATMLGADSVTDNTTAWAFAFGGYTLEIDKNLLDPGTNNNVNIV